MRAQSRWSLQALVMCSFALVTLSLGGALGYAIYSMENLAKESERLLLSALYSTRLIDQLQEQIPDLQRTARQYQVVSSPELAALYQRRSQRLLETLEALERFPWLPRNDSRLPDIRRGVMILSRQLSLDANQVDPSAFDELLHLAFLLHEDSSRSMDQSLDDLHRDVVQLRWAMLVLSLLLVGVVILLAAGFRRLVRRPLAQIDLGIRALGQAEFERPIQVEGPKDLADLGQLLNWLRERLRDLEAQKLTFVRHMSHELKTPLANVREGSELLLEELATSPQPQLRQLADIVRNNGLRLHRLIDDLFDFAAWHDDKSNLYLEQVDLGQLLRDICRDHQLDVQSRRLQLALNLPDNCILNADRRRLHSVLDNLLSNALKYSPEGTRVHIQVHAEDPCWVILVSDEGPGIPLDERERVFLPFFQGQPPVHARVRGTGIGLSIVQAAVVAHGGEIRILDKEPGAHFLVRLPMNPASNGQSSPSQDKS